MSRIHELIRDKRTALGMSQEELAKKVGYSGKSMIARIERGDVDLPSSKVKLFAKVLRITWEDLRDDFEADDFDDLVSGGYSIDEARARVKAGEIYYGKKVMALPYKDRDVVEALIDKLLEDNNLDASALNYDVILETLMK